MPKKPTPATWKRKATELHSKIIRSRGFCERCGASPPAVRLECSHFKSRRYAWTRTDLSNGAALCSSCHRFVGSNPDDHTEFFRNLVGEDEFYRIQKRALRRDKFDWEAEYHRLLAIWDDGDWLGVRCKECFKLTRWDDMVDGFCPSCIEEGVLE